MKKLAVTLAFAAAMTLPAFCDQAGSIGAGKTGATGGGHPLQSAARKPAAPPAI